uniref:Abnormal spindle-like microcephaly-associated protein ASH domain-containing protein n=1 Tax=Athene cunicularia TaxID=194338 RepID=A0A663LPD4_ATHCN
MTVRKQLNKLNKAATTIQAAFKSYLAKKDYKRLRSAVIVVQRHYRAIVHARCQNQKYLSLKQATVKVQAIYRGVRVRRQVHCMHQAAICIQATFKMHCMNIKYQAMRMAAIIIQRQYRAFCLGKVQRKKYLELKKSTVILQAACRGMKVRQDLKTMHQSAAVIQSYYRMHKQQRDFRKLLFATRRIQLWYRACKERNTQVHNYIIMKSAALRIQAAFRGMKTRRLIRTMSESAELIQRRFRTFLRRKHFLSIKTAATVIQRKYRATKLAKIQRKKYLTIKNSALVIQASYRGMKERQRLKIMHVSAIVIQSSYHMYVQRRYYKQLCWAVRVTQQRFRAKMVKEADMENYAKIKKAVICLQSSFRAKKARQLYKTNVAKAAAIKIQSMFRCQRTRMRYKLIQSSAVAIQRWYRACRKARLQKAQYSAQRQATVIIQSAFRGMKARKIARQIQAASKIQSFLQMAVQRRKFIQLRTAAITLQAYYLMHKTKSQYTSYKKAAIVLQRCYRSHLTVKYQRMTYLQTRRNIIIVQARIRGFLEKKRFHRIKESTIKIQTSYRGYKARQRVNRIRAAQVIQAWFRGCRARKEYASMLKAIRVIQSHFKTKQQRTRFLKMKFCAITIQRRWRATLTARMIQHQFLATKNLKAACLIQKAYRGFKARRKFLQQKTAAVIIQKHLRAWQEGRLKFMKYNKTRRAIIKLQAFIRGYLVRKKISEQKQKKRLLYFTAAAYHHISAIKIQRVYRIHRILKLAQNHISSVLIIQRWFRAKMQQKRFRGDYQRIIQLQRVIRSWLNHRNDAAAIIQRNVRRFLACTRRRKFAFGIIKFQALWRGYSWRKNNDTAKTKALRRSLEKANEKSKEENKLCNRTAIAIEYLLKYKHLSYILAALKHLEVATRLSPLCCENMAQSRAIFTIFVLIRSCNRSVPCMDVIRYSVQVLLNVSKYERTTQAVYEVENSIDTLLDLLQMYRGKAGDKISEKGGSIFTKTCCLLAILSKDSKRALVRLKSVNCIQSLYKLTAHKHKMDAERILVKQKTSTFLSRTSFVPVTPLRIKTVSRIKPDWVLRKDNMQEIVDPLQAILMVMDTLGIACY